MKTVSDPYRLRLAPQRYVVFATKALTSGLPTGSVFCQSLLDHCVFCVDGPDLAMETVVWGYKKMGQQPRYQSEKLFLMRRLFRTTNLTLWQSRQAGQLPEDLRVSMTAAFFSDNLVYLGSAGTNSVYLYRNGVIAQLITPDVDEKGRLLRSLGVERYGFMPELTREKLTHGDVLVGLTVGLAGLLSEDLLRSRLQAVSGNFARLDETAEAILVKLQTADSGAGIGLWLAGYVDRRVADSS